MHQPFISEMHVHRLSLMQTLQSFASHSPGQWAVRRGTNLTRRPLVKPQASSTARTCSMRSAALKGLAMKLMPWSITPCDAITNSGYPDM